jgi:hypothetical protein
MARTLMTKNNVDFDPRNFLAAIGEGRKAVASLR